MSGERILVVEDQATTAATVQIQLEGLGYRVAGVCSNAEQAIARARELSPHLVLMDIVLGAGPDGIEAARHIQDALDVPIVYMTAYADEMMVELAKTTRPAGFINKPVTAKDLLATIRLALHHAGELGREARVREESAGAAYGSGSIFADLSGTVHYSNGPAQSATGLGRSELGGRPLGEILALLYGLSEAEAASRIDEVLQSRQTQIVSRRTVFDGNNVATVYDTLTPVFAPDGELGGINLVLDDRTIPSRIAELDQTIDALAIAFETIPTGIVAVDADLNIRFMNRAAHDLLGQGRGLLRAGEQLAGATEADHKQLQGLLGDTLRLGREQPPLCIRGEDEGKPVEVVIEPLDTAGGRRTSGPAAMIFLFDSANDLRVSQAALQSLYGLTLGEARVAGLLVAGRSLEDVARELEISVHTVRTHLKHIYQKTGTRRQAELVHKIETGPAVLGLDRWRRGSTP